MTAIDLIIELSKLPSELEVVYDNTASGEKEFRMVIVENLGEIETDTKERYILLNCDNFEEEPSDEDDDEN
jgi:hypothetical protein